jgi:Calcineurin-like phosphoesterase
MDAMWEPLDLRNAESVGAALERAAETMRASPHRRGCVHHLPATGRLVVAGDLHDNPVHLQRIVTFARLAAAESNHVVLQELIHGDRLVNGVDLSYRVVARVADLVNRYPAQVHPLLANHELCQMLGIGVSKGYGDGTAMFNDGLDFVFGDDAQYVADMLAEFFRAMPLAVRTAGGIWCSHSIPSPETTDRLDPSIFARELSGADYAAPRGSAYLMVWGRGQQEEQVDRVAAMLDARLFCLGHAISETGAHSVTPRMAVINSDHERGRVAEIDLGAEPADADELVLSTLPLAALSDGEP